MVSTLKLPILKKGEYTLWNMRKEQYLTNIDYSLWQVILNGDGPIQVTIDEKGVETEVPPKIAQALLARQRERKAKSILHLAISDEYQLRFHVIKDAKTMWASIKSRFGDNVESKKMQKNVLKQQFENFSISDTEGLDKAYDRNKDGIDDLDIDDLYNNLKVFEADIKGSSGSSSNSQNVAFLSAEDTSCSNEVNTANGVSTTSGHNSQGQTYSSSYTDDLMFSFFANQSNSLQLDDEDLEQIDHDDLEEIDLKWQVAMLSIRVKRFYKKTERKLIFNGKEPVGNRNGDAGYRSKDNTRRTVPVESSNALVVQYNALIVQDRLGYDWSYIAQDEPTESALMAYTTNSSGSDIKANLENVAYQLGLESVEAQLVIHQKNEVVYEEKIAVLEFEVKEKNKTGLGYGDQLNENDSSGSELFNSVFDSRSSDGDDNQTNDRFKKDNGYHVVPPPLTGNYMPPLADLSFAGLDDFVYRPTTNKTSASVSQVEANITPPSNASVEMPRVESVRPSGVIIKDWVSDDEDIFQSNDLQATDKPSLKRIEFTNARNESVKPKQAEKPRIITQNPKLQPSNKRLFRRISVSAAKQSSLRATTSTSTFRPVNTATHTNRVNVSKLRTNAFHKSHSPIRRPFHKLTPSNTRISNEKVNTVRLNGVNTVGKIAVSTVKGVKMGKTGENPINFFLALLKRYGVFILNEYVVSKVFHQFIPIRHMAPLRHHDLSHPWLIYQVDVYDEGIVHSLHSEEEMAKPGFGAYLDGSKRVIPDKGDLRYYWIKISSDRDFLGPALSYVHIRDPGRKSGAWFSGEHFIRRLAAHFGLISDEGLRGLSVVVSEPPVIDLHDLGRLNICSRYSDTWAWAPQPPPPVPQPRTMSQRIDRIEEEICEL
ncbi:hypothetical protein Tco_0032816 [Tanacetum coccineum]